MTVYLSERDWQHAPAIRAMLDAEVEGSYQLRRGDYTCVEDCDELLAAELNVRLVDVILASMEEVPDE